MVTVIGTPRKNRSIMQAGTCQHTRSKLNQKYEIPTHIPKRLPGSTDPRFKRPISTRQKAEKSDESYCDTMKNGKQMVEMNMHALQELKKSENRLQRTIENMDNCYNTNKLLESVTKEEMTIIDCPIKNEQFVSEADHRKTVNLQRVINEQCNLEDRFPQVQKQAFQNIM
ncbi:uncharacterized protein LOC114928565 [Nylanderia fulva]|uniref:uncharacterized protein LOC114928565 n=1 Tax=Nylanderia fulva TaxID=613905 RepID=UPI0010FB6DB4|nr:uncharacterized protein LOC114928565 [Nylanderia fulva]